MYAMRVTFNLKAYTNTLHGMCVRLCLMFVCVHACVCVSAFWLRDGCEPFSFTLPDTEADAS